MVANQRDVPRSDTGPFVIVPQWVLDAPTIDDGAVRLYAVLARYADNGTGDCWPSRARLMVECRVKSVRTIDRRLADLVRAGAIAMTPRHDAEGNRTTTLYTVHRASPIARGGAADCTGGGATGDATPEQPVAHELDPLQLDPSELENARATESDLSRLSDPLAEPGADLVLASLVATQDDSRALVPTEALPASIPVEVLGQVVRVPLDFDGFWHLYPRKTGKGAARRAWERAARRSDPREVMHVRPAKIIDAVARMMPTWVNMEVQFIPHPATWLNQERWDDEPDAVVEQQRRGAQRGMAEQRARAGASIADFPETDDRRVIDQ